jgi:hypothetical protein
MACAPGLTCKAGFERHVRITDRVCVSRSVVSCSAGKSGGR